MNFTNMYYGKETRHTKYTPCYSFIESTKTGENNLFVVLVRV